MKKIKRYSFLFFTLLSYNAFAQLDSVAYLFKNNPLAQFRGELTFSIEKRIKPAIYIEASWGLLKYYQNVTILANEFILDEPNARVLNVTGINATLYLKKYLNKKNWLAGAYMSGGFSVLNDKINYQTTGAITGIPTDRYIEAKNVGIRYKMGYQTRWIANSYLDLSMATGFNFLENEHISQNVNFRYKKGLTGEFQLRLITAIHAKDTQSITALYPNKIKGSIWINPLAVFRKGLYVGGMAVLAQKWGTYGTLEAHYYQNKPFSQDLSSNNYKIYGFQIGSRNYMNRTCQGGYAGVFTGYNHLEITTSNFDLIPGPFPVFDETFKNIIKDQFAAGLQYGYIIRNSKSVFIDIGFQNGLRFGNKPFVSSNSNSFDFPNGTYTKLLIKVGSYIY